MSENSNVELEDADVAVFAGPITQEELIITWMRRRNQRLQREREERKQKEQMQENLSRPENPARAETSPEVKLAEKAVLTEGGPQNRSLGKLTVEEVQPSKRFLSPIAEVTVDHAGDGLNLSSLSVAEEASESFNLDDESQLSIDTSNKTTAHCSLTSIGALFKSISSSFVSISNSSSSDTLERTTSPDVGNNDERAFAIGKSSLTEMDALLEPVAESALNTLGQPETGYSEGNSGFGRTEAIILESKVSGESDVEMTSNVDTALFEATIAISGNPVLNVSHSESTDHFECSTLGTSDARTSSVPMDPGEHDMNLGNDVDIISSPFDSQATPSNTSQHDCKHEPSNEDILSSKPNATSCYDSISVGILDSASKPFASTQITNESFSCLALNEEKNCTTSGAPIPTLINASVQLDGDNISYTFELANSTNPSDDETDGSFEFTRSLFQSFDSSISTVAFQHEVTLETAENMRCALEVSNSSLVPSQSSGGSFKVFEQSDNPSSDHALNSAEEDANVLSPLGLGVEIMKSGFEPSVAGTPTTSDQPEAVLESIEGDISSAKNPAAEELVGDACRDSTFDTTSNSDALETSDRILRAFGSLSVPAPSDGGHLNVTLDSVNIVVPLESTSPEIGPKSTVQLATAPSSCDEEMTIEPLNTECRQDSSSSVNLMSIDRPEISSPSPGVLAVFTSGPRSFKHGFNDESVCVISTPCGPYPEIEPLAPATSIAAAPNSTNLIAEQPSVTGVSSEEDMGADENLDPMKAEQPKGSKTPGFLTVPKLELTPSKSTGPRQPSKIPRLNILKPSRLNINESGDSSISKSATSNILKPAKSNILEPATSSFSQPAKSNVLKPAKLNVEASLLNKGTNWPSRLNMKAIPKPKPPPYVRPDHKK